MSSNKQRNKSLIITIKRLGRALTNKNKKLNLSESVEIILKNGDDFDLPSFKKLFDMDGDTPKLSDGETQINNKNVKKTLNSTNADKDKIIDELEVILNRKRQDHMQRKMYQAVIELDTLTRNGKEFPNATEVNHHKLLVSLGSFTEYIDIMKGYLKRIESKKNISNLHLNTTNGEIEIDESKIPDVYKSIREEIRKIKGITKDYNKPVPILVHKSKARQIVKQIMMVFNDENIVKKKKKDND